MPVTTRLGNLDLAVLSDGQYFVDAGAVFGIVPRVLWEPHVPELDEHHRTRLALNGLLLRSGDKLILIAPGGELAFSPDERPALERALSGDPFTPAQLGGAAPEAMTSKLLAYGLIARS